MCRKFINSTPLGCLFVLVCFSSVFAQRGQSNPASLWNKSELHQVPEVKWTGIHDGIKSLIYAGTSYKENGTEVFAYYSNPDLIAGKKNTGKKYPAVVLIHGSGGTAFSQWVGRWARAGYAAIAMDLTGKDPTGKKLPKGGAGQSDETMFTDINKGNLKNMWTYQCVANIMLAHSLILSFPEVDKERTAITGISRGGYMTCVAAGVDHRFKAAVPVYGCGFIEESEVLKHGLNRLDDYWKKLWIQTFDPAVYFPGTKMPVMFVNGNKDMFYNVLPYAKSVNLLPVKNRYICIKPDMAHSHQDGWEPPEIEHFFNAILNGKKKSLPKVIVKINRMGQLTAKLYKAGDGRDAIFYYSNDTVSKNNERIWHRQSVKVSPNQNQIILKEVAKYNYGFLFFTNSKGISFSSNFIVLDKLP